jgi:hypothetical protein
MTAQYIRQYYGVPAKRGMQITVDGTPATIVGFAGARLRIRLDGRDGIFSAHPTWNVQYPNPASTAAKPAR